MYARVPTRVGMESHPPPAVSVRAEVARVCARVVLTVCLFLDTRLK
jgi:hypothetical protein